MWQDYRPEPRPHPGWTPGHREDEGADTQRILVAKDEEGRRSICKGLRDVLEDQEQHPSQGSATPSE